MGNTATDATAVVESARPKTTGNAERAQQAGKGVAAKCDKKDGEGGYGVIQSLWKYMNGGEGKPPSTDARATVSQVDEDGERPLKEDAESEADAVGDSKRGELEEDGDGTGEEYEDAEEEGEDDEEEDEGDAEMSEEPCSMVAESRFAPKTVEEIERLLLENLDGQYKSAVDSLTKMGYPLAKVRRVVQDYGSCLGDKDALSNIVCNVSEFLNGEASREWESAESRDDGKDADKLFQESLTELKRDGLACMVKKLQEVKPALGMPEALWDLLLADLDISKALTVEDNALAVPDMANGIAAGRGMPSPAPETARSFPTGPVSNGPAAAAKAPAGRSTNSQNQDHLASTAGAGRVPPSFPAAAADSASTSADLHAPTLRTSNGHTTANQGAPSGASRSSHAKGKGSGGKGKQPAGTAFPSNTMTSVHHNAEAPTAHRTMHTAKQRLHQTHKDSVRVLSSSKTKLVSTTTVRSEASSAAASAPVRADVTPARAAAISDGGGGGYKSSGPSPQAGASKDGTVSRLPAAVAATNASVNPPSQPISAASSALPSAVAAGSMASRDCSPLPPEGLQVALACVEAGTHIMGPAAVLGGEACPDLTGREYVEMASCLPPYMQVSPLALKRWVEQLEVRVNHLSEESCPPAVCAHAPTTGEPSAWNAAAPATGDSVSANPGLPAGGLAGAASSDVPAGEPGVAEGTAADSGALSLTQSQLAPTSGMDAQAIVGEVQELLLRVRHHAAKLPPTTIEELESSVDGLVGGSEPWMRALEHVLVKDGKETEFISGLLQKLKETFERVSMMEGCTLPESEGSEGEGDDSKRQSSACEGSLPVTPIAGKVVTPTASAVGISGRAAGLQDLLVSSSEDECAGPPVASGTQPKSTALALSAGDVSSDLLKLLDGMRSLFTAEANTGPAVAAVGLTSTRERMDAAGSAAEEAGSRRTSVSQVVDSILQKLVMLAESNRELLRHCLKLENMVSTMEQYRDERRTGFALELEKRVKELEVEAKTSISWGQEKVAQAARRLAKDSQELKSLRAEKEEVQKWKKDLQSLEETTSKKVGDLEAQLRKVGNESGELQKKFKQLQSELNIAKAEMGAAQLSASESKKEKEEMLKREKKLQKKLTTLENQRKKAADDLTEERRRAGQVERDLGQARERQQQAEVRWRQEEKAREEAVAKYEGEKRAREQAEAASKRREESLRRKAETDATRHREQVQALEREVAQLRLAAEGALLATSRWGGQGGTTEHTALIQALQSNNSRLQRDVVDLQEKLQEATRREVRRDRECVMCMSEEISVLFLPCAHEVVCSACNDRHLKQGMRDCPSCRTIIKQRIRVYGVS